MKAFLKICRTKFSTRFSRTGNLPVYCHPMTASIENIVQHLFHQPTLQSVSVDELQQMTQEYPSFAAARFLLLKKMQDSGHPDFTSQLRKTAIYFNNPLWLQLLLLPQKEASGGRRSANGHSVPPELP